VATSAQAPNLPGPVFRRTAYAAAILTFALIVVGGVVRISDSGLGCGPGGSGTKGWPLCGGRVVPLVNTHMIVEYSHRALAATVTALIASLVLVSFRRYRSDRRLVRTSLAALGLILFQAVLGGLTVEKGLEEELVAAHLGVAMLQIGLLIFLARLSRTAPREGLAPSAPGQPGSTRAIRTLAISASVAVLATIVAGGYMSASELHGTAERASAADPHTACGTDFPSCGGEFMPFGRSRAVDIHLTHRAFMYLASALVLALFLTVLRQRRRLTPEAGRRLTRASGAAVAILLCQVTLGALNVWLGEHPWLVVVHLAVGALLWVSLVFFSLLVLGAPQPVAASPRRKTSVQPAAAGGHF
jgi:cytochrome c oxidase assembly protein subunit 15